jgi:hypothetical protein
MPVPRSRIWPEVTSPAARRVVEFLFNYHGSYTDADFLDRLPELEFSLQLTGLGRLWRSLSQSDIAVRLAGGPALLPDIAAALPPFYRAVYRLFRPRTLEQQVNLLVQHLEWYLAPSQPALPGLKAATLISAPLVVLLGVLSVVVFIGVRTGAGSLFTSVALAVAAVTLSLVNLPAPLRSLRTLLYADRQTASRNATVLYHHLRRAYADVKEPQPGDRVRSHLVP